MVGARPVLFWNILGRESSSLTTDSSGHHRRRVASASAFRGIGRKLAYVDERGMSQVSADMSREWLIHRGMLQMGTDCPIRFIGNVFDRFFFTIHGGGRQKGRR